MKLRSRAGLRAAAAFAWLLGGLTSFALIVVASSGDFASLDSIALRGTEAATWLIGGVTCISASRWRAESRHHAAPDPLLYARGYGQAEQTLAQSIGTHSQMARLFTVALALPWLLATCAVDSLQLLAARCIQLLLVLGYLAVLVLGLEALARGSARLWPKRPATALALLVFGPDLVRSAYPTVPSFPRLAEQALRVISDLGVPA